MMKARVHEARLILLPVDLLLHIFLKCPSIQCAVILSGVNRRLRQIWLQHARYIATSILATSRVPAFGDAISLAINEAHLCPSTGPSDDPPASIWIPRLVFHTESAARISASFFKWAHNLGKIHPLHEKLSRITSPEASYYFVWHLAISYHLPLLQPGLRARLESAALTPDILMTHYEVGQYVAKSLDPEEASRQGIYRDGYIDGEVDSFWKYGFDDVAEKDEWLFADRLLDVADVRYRQLEYAFAHGLSTSPVKGTYKPCNPQ